MNVEKFSMLLKKMRFRRLALILLLVNVVVTVLVVLPQHNRVLNLQASSVSLKKQLAVEQREVKNLRTRLQNLRQSQADLKTIYDKVLMSRSEGVTAIRLELESLTRSMQNARQDFSYTYDDLPDFGLQVFHLGVPVEGNYRSLRQFINSIENSKHFLILDRVELSSEKKADVLNLDFRISTYLVNNEQAKTVR